MKSLKHLTLLFIIAALNTHCGGDGNKANEQPFDSSDSMTYPNITVPPPGTGMSAMVENFCDQLWDENHNGNADIKFGTFEDKIRLGSDQYDLSYSYHFFQRAVLAAKDRLPQPFGKYLESKGYFEILKKYLTSKPDGDVSVDEAIEMREAGTRLVQIWNWAFSSAITKQMSGLYEDFHRKVLRRAWKMKKSRMERELKASIYKSIWEENSFYKKAVAQFAEVKSAYLETLDSLNLDASIRNDWKAKIASVEIVPPGSNPDALDEDCARQEENAYYSRHFNTVTICGGYLVSTNLLGTLAHELSHALGNETLRIRYQKNSIYHNRMKKLRAEICEAKEPACPGSWQEFKNSQEKMLDLMSTGFQPQNPKLLACLQYHENEIKSIDRSVVENEASSRAAYQISDYVDSHAFIETISRQVKVTTKDDTLNPTYFNPCGYYDWNETNYDVGDQWDLLFFYSASYLCDDSRASSEKLVKAAIEEARKMHTKTLEYLIPIAGRFSSDSEMQAKQFAEDSEERFADRLGYEVFARMLAKNPENERGLRFATSLAKFCDSPTSIQKTSAADVQAEKQFSFEPHSIGLQRRQETEIEAIRAITNYTKDFTIKECSIQPEPAKRP